VKVGPFVEQFKLLTRGEAKKVIDNLRRSPYPVSINYYRWLVKTYLKWKPMELREYVLKRKLTEKQWVIYTLEKARRESNKRITEIYRLKKGP